MTNTNTEHLSPAAIDGQLLRLANTHRNVDDSMKPRAASQLRLMIRGKAWKLIQNTYGVPENRESIWRE